MIVWRVVNNKGEVVEGSKGKSLIDSRDEAREARTWWSEDQPKDGPFHIEKGTITWEKAR